MRSLVLIAISLTVMMGGIINTDAAPFISTGLLQHYYSILVAAPNMGGAIQQCADTNQDKNFSPTECQATLFGSQYVTGLEPLWAQWRTGSFLKNRIMTDSEKKRSVKAGLIDGGAPQSYLPMADAVKVCTASSSEEPPVNYDMPEEICHAGSVAGLMCSQDSCSSGVPENVDLYFYNDPEISETFNTQNEESIQKNNFLTAIKDATRREVKLMNISMVPHLSREASKKYYQTTFKGLRNTEMQVVWSSGNVNARNMDLLDVPEQVSFVGSIDPLLQRSDFSTYGPSLGFVMPSDYTVSSIGESTFGGTSGAAPQLSGLYINLLKINPNFPSEDLKKISRLTSIDLDTPGFDENTGHGMANAPKAMWLAQAVANGTITLSEDDSSIKRNLQKLLSERHTPLSYAEVISKSHSCSDYKHQVESLFINYFVDPTSLDARKPLCHFYKMHQIWISAALYCDGKDKPGLVGPLLAIMRQQNEQNKRIAQKALAHLGSDVLDEIKQAVTNKKAKLIDLASLLARMGGDAGRWLIEEIKLDPQGLLVGHLRGMTDIALKDDLVTLLSSKDQTVRITTLGVLSSMSTPDTLQLVREHFFKEKDEATRRYIISVLSQQENGLTPEYLASVLGDKSPYVIKEALWQAAQTNDPKLLSAVKRYLTDENEEIRLNAARAISPFSPDTAIPVLTSLLEGPQGLYASNALTKMGWTAYETLQEVITNPKSSAKAKRYASVAIGDMDISDEEKRVLLPYLDSSDENVRLAAMWGLSASGMESEEVTVAALKQMESSSEAIKDPAARILSEHAQPHMAKKLFELFYKSDEKPHEWHLSKALGKVNHEASIEFSKAFTTADDNQKTRLLNTITFLNPSLTLRGYDSLGKQVVKIALNPSETVKNRQLATMRLGAFLPLLNHETLKKLSSDPDPSIRKQTIQMIGYSSRVQTDYSLPYFVEASEDPDSEVRQVAIRALRYHVDKPFVRKLLRAKLTDPDMQVISKAVIGLGIAKDPEAIEGLTVLLQRLTKENASYIERNAAIQALVSIGDPSVIPTLKQVIEQQTYFSPLGPKSRAIEAIKLLALMSDDEAIKQDALDFIHSQPDMF